MAGWLMLRGRARCCGERISVLYPLVELATGATWALLAAITEPVWLARRAAPAQRRNNLRPLNDPHQPQERKHLPPQQPPAQHPQPPARSVNQSQAPCPSNPPNQHPPTATDEAEGKKMPSLRRSTPRQVSPEVKCP